MIESMTADQAQLAEPAPPLLMDAVLTPNRSLPRAGFAVLMAGVVAVSFTAGVIFIRMGAWPVTGFFGLDLALIWLAFRFSYRDGRTVETVRLSPERLQVTRRRPQGHVQRWTLAPLWTEVRHLRPGRHDAQVVLTSRGRALVLGGFLAPEERDAFAARLAQALAQAKLGLAQGSGGEG